MTGFAQVQRPVTAPSANASVSALDATASGRRAPRTSTPSRGASADGVGVRKALLKNINSGGGNRAGLGHGNGGNGPGFGVGNTLSFRGRAPLARSSTIATPTTAESFPTGRGSSNGSLVSVAWSTDCPASFRDLTEDSYRELVAALECMAARERGLQLREEAATKQVEHVKQLSRDLSEARGRIQELQRRNAQEEEDGFFGRAGGSGPRLSSGGGSTGRRSRNGCTHGTDDTDDMAVAVGAVTAAKRELEDARIEWEHALKAKETSLRAAAKRSEAAAVEAAVAPLKRGLAAAEEAARVAREEAGEAGARAAAAEAALEKAQTLYQAEVVQMRSEAALLEAHARAVAVSTADVHTQTVHLQVQDVRELNGALEARDVDSKIAARVVREPQPRPSTSGRVVRTGGGGEDDSAGRFQALESMLSAVAKSEQEVMETRQRMRGMAAELRQEREARMAAEAQAKLANAKAEAVEARLRTSNANVTTTSDPSSRTISSRRTAPEQSSSTACIPTSADTSASELQKTPDELDLRRQLAGREAAAEETRLASHRIRSEAAERMRRLQQLEAAAAAVEGSLADGASANASLTTKSRASVKPVATALTGQHVDEVGMLWNALQEAQSELSARRGVVSTAIAAAARCRRDIESGAISGKGGTPQ